MVVGPSPARRGPGVTTDEMAVAAMAQAFRFPMALMRASGASDPKVKAAEDAQEFAEVALEALHSHGLDVVERVLHFAEKDAPL